MFLLLLINIIIAIIIHFTLFAILLYRYVMSLIPIYLLFLKLIFYYLFIVLFIGLFCCIFCLQLLLCLFPCFKKFHILRSYAASCNFIPIGHEIPLENCVSYIVPVEERHEFIIVITILAPCHHHHQWNRRQSFVYPSTRHGRGYLITLPHCS